MSTLWITRGLPGSGKTTWAVSMQVTDPDDIVRVNRDDTRTRLFGSADQDYYDCGKEALQRKESLVTEATHSEITASLKAGFDVIVDDTNLPVKRCRDLRRLATQAGADFQIKDFSVATLGLCLERNAARTDKEPVPEDVIRGMHKRFIQGGLAPVPDEEKQDFTAMVPVEWDRDKPLAFIFDIDGTLAHIPEGGRSPYDYSRVGDDEVDESVAYVLDTLQYRSGAKVFLVSGRKDECREETEGWLWDKGIVHDGLFMRATEDNRPDWQVKYELFDKHIRPAYRVMGVFDDRVQVLRMWEQIGLKTFRVGGLEGGNF